jgi:hypothetical protein
MRRCAALAVFAAWFFVNIPSTWAAPAGLRNSISPETTSLRSISGWLRDHGREGFLGADVADAMGIARHESEDRLEARQRGFRSDDVLRIAQVAADGKRDFLLFMVQQPDGQVFFYLSSVRDGLRKAFVSIPSRNLVVPLERGEAEASFLQELLYWEDKAAMR